MAPYHNLTRFRALEAHPIRSCIRPTRQFQDAPCDACIQSLQTFGPYSLRPGEPAARRVSASRPERPPRLEGCWSLASKDAGVGIACSVRVCNRAWKQERSSDDLIWGTGTRGLLLGLRTSRPVRSHMSISASTVMFFIFPVGKLR